MTRTVVVGAGRFGSRAVREIRRIHPGWGLTVIDRTEGALSSWSKEGLKVQLGEAVEVLDKVLSADPPEWVVPAVPFHLAHAWVSYRLSQMVSVKSIPVPKGLPVPNPMVGATGDLYVSYADFLCPEDCNEPRGRCTVTGEERPTPMFQLLGDLEIPQHRVLGLRSRQLGPGVGGLRNSELLNLLEKARDLGGKLIVYTACRCHGVLSGMHVQ